MRQNALNPNIITKRYTVGTISISRQDALCSIL